MEPMTELILTLPHNEQTAYTPEAAKGIVGQEVPVGDRFRERIGTVTEAELMPDGSIRFKVEFKK